MGMCRGFEVCRSQATDGFPLAGYKDNAWWVNPPIKADGTYAGGLSSDFVCSLDDEDNGIRSGKLYPYVGTSAAYHCPADRSYLKPVNRGGKRSYSITGLMHGEMPNSPECADWYFQIKSPAAKMVFVETTDDRGWNMGSWIMNAAASPAELDRSGNRMACITEAALDVFADGHAEVHAWVDTSTIADD